MEDDQIIDLYWNRKEQAIYETDKKYGKYCSTISFNILQDKEDSNECINDTYMKLWGAIPPQKPNVFKAYIGKIVRNLALNRYEKNRAKKRNKMVEVALEELGECVVFNKNVENEIVNNELIQELNKFLAKLSFDKRKIFLERYWYIYSIKDIAIRNKLNENNVKMILLRIRNDLKEYLKEGGLYE